MLRWAVLCTGTKALPAMHSCIDIIESRYGLEMLARKLAQDRDLLFDILIPSSDMTFRHHMDHALEKVCNERFEYINSATDYKVKPLWQHGCACTSSDTRMPDPHYEKTILKSEYRTLSFLGEAMQG